MLFWAHGLNNIYPKENKNLVEKIINKGGTVLSEYNLWTKADKSNF
ncbi:MAG TPA: DNA-protecting protein DprA, partial [Clostridiales bacterium]|nr:DNA-protecting protein DprA [Clostridiales bacterium]